MLQNSGRTSPKSSASLIRRILYRFKMIKRNSNPSITDSQQRSSREQYSEYFNEKQSEWQYKKVSPENLEPFCEQLEIFLKYVRNIQQLTYLTYECPSFLQSRLEREANELQSLYLEVKDAVINIERLKMQRKNVRKEKSCIKRALKKLREEEVRQMENVICMNDKTMFARWENVKNTHKPEILEILLTDVKGKQQALEYLNTLVSRRLGQLQIFVPLLTSAENAAAAILASTPPTISLTPTANSNTSDNQSTSTLPKRNHHTSSSSSRSESRRKRRRNQEQHENSSSTRTTQSTVRRESNTDLSLIPFNVGPNPFQIIGTSIALPVSTTTTTTTTASNSSHELITLGSSLATTNNFRNNDGNNSSSNTNIGSEFQNEMRTVIQALFGELRQSSPTTISSSNSEHENDNVNHTNQEIELYTIRRSQQPQPEH